VPAHLQKKKFYIVYFATRARNFHYNEASILEDVFDIIATVEARFSQLGSDRPMGRATQRYEVLLRVNFIEAL